MLQFLSELLVAAAVEGAWHGIVRAAKGSGTQGSPYDWNNDPVYKKSLQRLIERNRQFEEARNEPRS